MPRAPWRKQNERSAWTAEQNQALEAAVAKYGDNVSHGKWKAIAKEVPGRNSSQCRQRYKHSIKHGRHDAGHWSKAQTEELLAAIAKTKRAVWGYWPKVAKGVSGRTDKQCEYRSKYLLTHPNACFGLNVPAFKLNDVNELDVLTANIQATLPLLMSPVDAANAITLVLRAIQSLSELPHGVARLETILPDVNAAAMGLYAQFQVDVHARLSEPTTFEPCAPPSTTPHLAPWTTSPTSCDTAFEFAPLSTYESELVFV